jgi:DNA-binding NarL/FixJ family response regulator
MRGEPVPTTVLIADDHPLIREALTALFDGTEDIVVVGEVSDGTEVLEAVTRWRPQVVLMDLQMPVMDGLEATRLLQAEHPEVRVIVLTGGLTPATACEAKALGVAGYLLKEDDPGSLPDRVRTVAAGGTAWSTKVAAAIESGWESLTDMPSDGRCSPYVDESPRNYR